MICCGKKKNKVFHEPKINQTKTFVDEPLSQKEFSSLFWKEVLTCGTCNHSFVLKEHEIVAYCGGCYKFLHCGIAGKCVGPNCNYLIKNKIHKDSWCLKCIPKDIIINIENVGDINCDCLCQECYDDPNTPNQYKRKY